MNAIAAVLATSGVLVGTTLSPGIISTGAFTCAVATGSMSLPAQAPNLRPGKYEVTAEISMPGRAGKLPPRKEVACITAQDLQDWSRRFVKQDARSCKTLDSETTATAFTFTTECTSADGSRTTYKGDVTITSPGTYDAVVNIRNPAATNPMLQGSTITTKARRIGDCEK